MEVTKTQRDALNAVVHVHIKKEDISPKVMDKLRKYRKDAHMKGFRKGKTPMSVVRKMYGKAVQAEVVNELIQQGVGDFLQEEQNVLGQPLPSEEQVQYDFSNDLPEEMTFSFDIGVYEPFKIAGVSADDTFTQYIVEVNEDALNEAFEQARTRVGKWTYPENSVEENDAIRLLAKEMEDGVIKTKGFQTSFQVMVNQLNDTVKEAVQGKAKGDSIQFNIYELEKNRDEAYVRKHFLQLDTDEEERSINQDFEGTIEEIRRWGMADMDQEFFDKYFGKDEVKTEDEAKDKMTEYIEKDYSNQSDVILFREWQDRVLSDTQIELPEVFLKRWLKETNEEKETEGIDEGFDKFVESLRWSLIQDKLVGENDIDVTQEEIQQGIYQDVMRYGAQYGLQNDPQFMQQLVQQMMQDERQISEKVSQIKTNKVFEAIKDKIGLQPTPISKEELEEKIKALQPVPENTEEE